MPSESLGIRTLAHWPVAFESQQMNPQQQRYPTHEQELLSIIRALSKWHVDLLGTHINIYTDHRTLENFDFQRDLSRRQCRWQEFLSQYDYTITYIKGEDNTIADAMSRLPDGSTMNSPLPTDPDDVLLAGVFSIAADNELIRTVKDGYKLDPFCVKLNDAPDSCPGLRVVDGLMYLGNRLIIPCHGDIREMLFLLAHDSLGHF